MHILGLSGFYHDSAAALVSDGEIVAAAQEERFSRRKHDPDFPAAAAEYCLHEGGISAEELDYVVFYDKPFVKFERMMTTYLAVAPRGIRSFFVQMPFWLKEKLFVQNIIRKRLEYDGPVLYTMHHQAHAASAFFPSPFDEAAFLTLDGVGEWATSTYGVGRGNKVEILKQINFPHSLGLLYSAFTYFTGFKVNSGEYKLMGLAPYGTPKYTAAILEHLIDVKEDGSFRLNMEYFDYCGGLRMTNERFAELFGGPARPQETEITQREMDLAASVQTVTEEVILRMARAIYNHTGMRHLTLAGGVALNCVANGRVLRESPFDDIWIQPSAGDAGGALGAALFAWHQLLDNERHADGRCQRASYLGPHFPDDAIEAYLEEERIHYERFDEEALCENVARLLAMGKVVGWFQGRMEFGPRALGARSILGDARSPAMQSLLNRKIKFRESFRPFAPSVLAEYADQYFNLDRQSPYMLLVAPVQGERLAALEENEANAEGFDKLRVARSEIPAVTHVDNSARIQTVDKRDNPLYHRLLARFRELTGCPVIINTSFNVRGEPIVCAPKDAYTCFMRTQMDYLAMGPFLLDKALQQEWPQDDAWREDYPLD